MPQRWFIRNISTDPSTGRIPQLRGYQNSVGHVTEMIGHVPEFDGHDAETVGHALPKYPATLRAGAPLGTRGCRGPLVVVNTTARIAPTPVPNGAPAQGRLIRG